LFFMVIGGILAMMVRWQLGFPDKAMPLGRLFPENLMPEGHMDPSFYNQVFSMHGTVMIFLVIIPILAGAFGNFLIPLMIGARDMAFPRLNMLSFWVGATGGVIMATSFFVATGPAATGWTASPPLSAVVRGDGRRPGASLAAPLLVLLSPRRLHHDPPGDGFRLRHHRDLRAQADLRLQGDGLLARRDRRAGIHRVGSPYVPERHE